MRFVYKLHNLGPDIIGFSHKSLIARTNESRSVCATKIR